MAVISLEQRLPIKAVVRRTGLTSHVIRIWERRYGAVSPLRTTTNRRLYSAADVERLLLLRRATGSGRSIGQIAHLSTEKLQELVATDEAAGHIAKEISLEAPAASAQAFLDDCIAAVRRFDAESLETTLTRSSVAFSQPVLFSQILTPLLNKIGDLWRDGELRVAHEHLASAIIRTFLGNMRGGFDLLPGAPTIIISTPSGHLHELGAMLVAATAAAEGWRVLYLGPNLPVEDLALAAEHNQARAVALSLIYPTDDPRLNNELKRLRRTLQDNVALLIGGRAADNYRIILDEIGVPNINDLTGLRFELERLRNGKRS